MDFASATSAAVAEVRTLTGFANNPFQPRRGSAPGLLARGPEGVCYADGLRRPMDRGNERRISRRLFALGPALHQRAPSPLNMLGVLFGQFLNHDLEDNHFFGHFEDNNKSFVTPDSPYQFVWVLDPDDPIATFMGRNRLLAGEPCGVPFKPSTGAFVDGVFHPGNLNSSFLDLGQVYGADRELAATLRSGVGGRLRTDDYRGTTTYRTEAGPVRLDFDVTNLAPSRATTGLMVDSSFSRLALNEVCTAGDPRCSENIGLMQLHVLFLREHNRRADELARLHPDWEDEALYQQARRLTIALWQHIVVEEWAPLVVGPGGVEALGRYRGFKPQVDPTTSVAFASAGLRFGHPALNPYVPRHADGSISTRTDIATLPRDASLPNVGQVNNGISPMGHYALAGGTPEHVLRGMLATRANPVGVVYSEAIHDIAFVSGGTDLLTLDLARGRDNGLPPYHVLRACYTGVEETDWDGAAQADTISETEKRAMIDARRPLERRAGLDTFLRFAAADPAAPTDDELAVAGEIREIYRRADSIDPIVGMLAEPHQHGAAVGPTTQAILVDQLQRSRDGDRFWYENGVLDAAELAEVKATRMADVLARNFELDALERAFEPANERV